MKKYAIAPLVLAAAFSFTACEASTESEGKVKEKATASASPSPDAEESEAPDSEETVSEEEVSEGESETSAAVGDLVTLDVWDVKVDTVHPDAWPAIKKANMFNDKPKGEYVLVTYEATYTGDERMADTRGGIRWTLTTADATVLDQAFVVTPADSESWPTEVRKGGTARHQVVFDVPKGQLEGGILTAEVFTEDFDTVFADFNL